MQYIKHYYVDDENNTFCCKEPSPAKYKRHPWKEYPGLDVKIWLVDSEGVDVCIAEVPDSTPVSTIMNECGKNSIQVITETEYNSVANPYFEAQSLFNEAMVLQQEQGDETLIADKLTSAQEKINAATQALHSL